MYYCIISEIGKSEAMNLMQNLDLTEAELCKT